MATCAQFLLDAPVPIVTTALALRYGPSALLVLLAGGVAVLVPGQRGERALVVLRLCRRSAPARRKRIRRATGIPEA
ncbi:hypothetical protein [Amycolatopsis cihanbeyliensis]|uniref:Uncharacterized protein n=1 Tax=Amycolatopsis cihanbeyliensis TaxID=1128664 RepID=A0A542DK82_AMYCI|nr:hypothetical protein [Amycolatopsis cihanbeyliensis]TQJ03509.1 hypothetical protein FB471_3271 [Amycolatopsis cihanbeyliensis]